MINSRTMQLVGTAVATDTISLDSDDLVSLVAEHDVSVGDARDDNDVDTLVKSRGKGNPRRVKGKGIEGKGRGTENLTLDLRGLGGY